MVRFIRGNIAIVQYGKQVRRTLRGPLSLRRLKATASRGGHSDDLTLVRVTAGHFCAGLEIDATGRCVRAAPILKWCVGMGRDDLRAEFERRGYRATVVRRISSES